ncbi:MAG: DUF502 domain-containing protein [Candidatus Goldbacteria bacterium]|nr:DUF502 domain-containing protein [Candidatus Goldiibacteriota bacterium]
MPSGFIKRFWSKILAGLIVILPAFLTVYITYFLLNKLDSILGPLLTKYIGISIPGLGLIALILLLWITGLFATHYLGKKMVQIYETVISRIPVLKQIFGGIKQISDTLFAGKRRSFRQAALVQYPYYGFYAIGFITSQDEVTLVNSKNKGSFIHVFIPTTPNPTSGFLILVPPKNIVLLDTPVEDALKTVISLGMIHPEKYTIKKVTKKSRKKDKK